MAAMTVLQKLVFVPLIVSLAGVVEAKRFCQGGLILPHDPEVVAGKELYMNCTMNKTCHRADSTQMYFSFPSFNVTAAQGFVKILSPSKIEVRIPNVTEAYRGMVRCMINSSKSSNEDVSAVVSNQIVEVLAALEAPHSYKCIVYDTTTLNCTWTYNYTFLPGSHFNITYMVSPHDGWWVCPHPVRWTVNNHTFISCQWSPKDGYQDSYKPNLTYDLTFTLIKTLKHRNESLATTYRLLVDDRTVIVKPDKVKDFEAITLSSNTVQLSWKTAYFEEHLLLFMINFTSDWDSGYIERSQSSENEQEFVRNISGLIPYTKYTFNIASKPNIIEALYTSDTVSASAETASTAPLKAPIIPPGGFTQLDVRDGCRKIRLYWQALNEADHYGKFKGYRISYNGNVTDVGQTTYYRDFDLSAGPGPHVFQVYSLNTDGQSQEHSSIRIENEALKGDHIVFGVERSGKNEVHLMWKAPEIDYIDGFVIYMCEENIFCTNPVQFFSVDAEKRDAYADTTEILKVKVGIAVVTRQPNSTQTYSGIQWADCIFPYTADAPVFSSVAKAPDVKVSNETLQSATFTWDKLSCEESRFWVTNYILKCCEASNCLTTTRNKSINQWNQLVSTGIKGLVPNTEYKVWVVANTSKGILKTDSDKSRHFRTKFMALDLNVIGEDSSSISAICPPLARSLSANIVVAYTDPDGIKQTYQQPCGQDKQTLSGFNCDHREEYEVLINFKAMYNGQLIPNKPIPMNVCRKLPLSPVVIPATVISCIVAGMIFVIFIYCSRKFWRKESRSVPRSFQYAGDSDLTVTLKDEDENYLSRGCDSSMACTTFQKPDIEKSGPRSTSSTTPLLSPDTSVDDVFNSKGHEKQRNDHPLSYSKFGMRVEESDQACALPETYAQFAEESGFGHRELELNELHRNNNGNAMGGYVTCDQIPQDQGQGHLYDPVRQQSTQSDDELDSFHVIDVHVPSIKDTLQREPEVFGRALVPTFNSFQTASTASEGNQPTSPSELQNVNTNPRHDAQPSFSNSENHHQINENFDNDINETLVNSAPPVNESYVLPPAGRDTQSYQTDDRGVSVPLNDMGYVTHDAVLGNCPGTETDSGWDENSGSSGETLTRKQDSGYMSPEYRGGPYNFKEEEKQKQRHESDSSNESPHEAPEVVCVAPQRTNAAGYITWQEIPNSAPMI